MSIADPAYTNDRVIWRPLRAHIARTYVEYHDRRGNVRAVLIEILHRNRAPIWGNFYVTCNILLLWKRAELFAADCVQQDQRLTCASGDHKLVICREVDRERLDH